MDIHDLGGEWGTMRVTTLGACVLSWRPTGAEDVLFVSRRADPTPGSMWHGGIPVCAPWFGCGQGDWAVPHPHGLVSRVAWRTESVEQDPEGGRVVLGLASDSVSHLPGAERYPADVSYRLEVNAGAASLSVALSIASPTQGVSVDAALHPYLRVDTPRAVLTGLDGVPFDDAAHGWQPGVQRGSFSFGPASDRVYKAAPSLLLRDGPRSRRLTSRGASRTVVWNPGPSGDLAEEWAQFVCVEYGNVRDGAVWIPAGGSHSLSMTIAV